MNLCMRVQVYLSSIVSVGLFKLCPVRFIHVLSSLVKSLGFDKVQFFVFDRSALLHLHRRWWWRTRLWLLLLLLLLTAGWREVMTAVVMASMGAWRSRWWRRWLGIAQIKVLKFMPIACSARSGGQVITKMTEIKTLKVNWCLSNARYYI